MKIIADENIPFVKECFSSVGNCLTVHGRKITREILKDADVLLVRTITKVDKNLLEDTKVKFVATATIGFEHVDVNYLADKNIGFSSAPGSNANSVAEYIVSALLNLADKYEFDISKKTIGIVGVGNVGSKVEKKARALGMKVILNDPPLKRQTNDEKYRPVEEILDCDIVTLHVPLTYEGIDKTYHLADEKFFKSLKKGVIFCNSCRGKVHDTAALKNAITAGKIKACVLDVWEKEPNIDIELLKILDYGTPHIAGYSYDGKVSGMIMIYDAFCKHFAIKPKFNINNFLPPSQIERIIINENEGKPLSAAVNMLYDIKRDDAKLRQIIEEPAERRIAYFDSLRKNYHVRREFQNTFVSIKDERLKKIFSGLGFKTV
ncbi:MAG: 4-phosphoerythronate dehydrogenase [Planctomycetes bacterium]|nr:4-phosphoerythronate dehydrogenase [Planctomycetota bacterium]MBU1518772.1 4-phosphoerythronate dehydrogenase [Planctomycetota bacterium]MBU2457587.1 4-phosphoerythronate dehydrogenase [Planctomycetota bacterium]